MDRLNTSYARKYIVVSKSETSAVLRVVDESLYSTYWKEFISADIEPKPPVPPEPVTNPMILRVEQVPPEVALIDQFSTFSPEMPIIYLEVDGKRYNITSKVVVNTPNTEVPGLFRLDYRVNFTHEFSSVFWESYVSIQQRPLLRKAAAGWTRDSYITRTLNRLVMEPQFMEALHAAGDPLYGFMQANQHPSIRAGRLHEYAGVQAWGSGNAVGEDGDRTIFVTGPKLPQGSVVIYQRRILQLQEPVFPDVMGSGARMNPETHERAPSAYGIGAVRRYGESSYVCIAPADTNVSVKNTDYWRQGYLYRFSTPGSDTFTIPYGPLPSGKGGIEHIWATVDNQGYPFWVDILHVTEIGTYRGYYNKSDFSDYGPDDIVSCIQEGMMHLFCRKRTDIQDESTLMYPPGHYLNPAWEEIYCHMPDEYSPLLSEYYVVPHTNSTNAVIAKTWSVSEEMCQAYSHMVGIPQSILEECGAKWSALLFALLTRTRNTFDGLRLCMQAVGLDVKNLIHSEPFVSYYYRDEGSSDEVLVEDIYEQRENLRKIAANVATLEPFGSEGREEEGALRYNPDDATGCTIDQYTDGAWVPRYRFAKIEPSQNYNNRYFDGDLDILARLAEDAVMDLGDGKQWVKATAWAGKYSALVGDVIAYEIPIYVWLRLHMYLYDESRIEMETAVYSGVLDSQRCGGKNVIELFPTYYYSWTWHDLIEIPTGVFHKENDAWVEIQPTYTNEENGSKVYEFDQIQYPIKIQALDRDKCNFIRYWQSTHTFGLLGLRESDSTDHFRNVTDPAVTDESELMLANGHVGVTALYTRKMVQIEWASAPRWMYVLNDTDVEETWILSDSEQFAEYVLVNAAPMYPFDGTLDEFKEALDHITLNPRGGDPIPYEWQGNRIAIYGVVSGPIYFKSADHNIISAITIDVGPYALTEEDWEIYRPENTGYAIVSFIYR